MGKGNSQSQLDWRIAALILRRKSVPKKKSPQLEERKYRKMGVVPEEGVSACSLNFVPGLQGNHAGLLKIDPGEAWRELLS